VQTVMAMMKKQEESGRCRERKLSSHAGARSTEPRRGERVNESGMLLLTRLETSQEQGQGQGLLSRGVAVAEEMTGNSVSSAALNAGLPEPTDQPCPTSLLDDDWVSVSALTRAPKWGRAKGSRAQRQASRKSGLGCRRRLLYEKMQ